MDREVPSAKDIDYGPPRLTDEDLARNLERFPIQVREPYPPLNLDALAEIGRSAVTGRIHRLLMNYRHRLVRDLTSILAKWLLEVPNERA